MSKKHDENKDVRLLSRKVRVDVYNKSISANKSTIIGNRSWGRIDFLVNYCGYHFFWDNNAKVITKSFEDNDNKKSKRDYKKASKEQTLTNKNNKKRKQ